MKLVIEQSCSNKISVDIILEGKEAKIIYCSIFLMSCMTSKNGSNTNLDSRISKAKSDFQLCDEPHPVVEITEIIGSKDDIETAEEDHDNGENDREDAE